MDQHHIWLALFEHVTHTGEHAGGDIVQVLSLLHNVEIIVRLHLEYLEHLVQHLAVLTGHTHNCLKIFRIFLELLHQRAHLDGLWPGSEDKHYFFHWLYFVIAYFSCIIPHANPLLSSLSLSGPCTHSSTLTNGSSHRPFRLIVALYPSQLRCLSSINILMG